MAEANADVGQLTFERAIEELETIVKRLEEGKVPLEESVAIYERGETLKRRCEQLLRQAEARVEKITLDAAGAPVGTEPLDGTNGEAARQRPAPPTGGEHDINDDIPF
jgi:exodeoxyribonuclease VII small subunit